MRKLTGRTIDRRRRVARAGAVALLGVTALALPIALDTSTVAAAGSSTELLAIDGQVVAGISDDGRYVMITNWLNGGDTVLLDRTTRATRAVPPGSVLSGDGQHVAFLSADRLAAEDADSSADVYVLDVASGTTTLHSHGFDGWEFGVVDIDQHGDSVLIGGVNGNLASLAPFVGTATATQQLGVGLDPITSGDSFALSADGRYALYSANASFSGAHHGELYREDTVTHERIVVNTTADGGLVFPQYATMSGDGRTVLVASLTAVYRGPAQPRSLTLLSTAHAQYAQEVGLSNDGTTAAWIEPKQTTYDGYPTIDDDQVVVDGPSGRIVASAPTSGVPNGGVRGGPFLSGDGSAVAFASLATNLTSSPATGWSTYIRVFGPSSTASSPSAYAPLTPTRIVDTRIALGVPGNSVPGARSTIHVPVRGLHGVPNDATAVALQIAAAEGLGIGFVSVIPGGAQPGLTANLNLDHVGQVIANMAVVPIGADGSVDVYVQARTHVIVDLLGSWSPAPFGAAAGRLQPIGPNRLLDTRAGTAVGYSGPKPASGGITTVQVTGRAGVPDHGVSAVVLNVAVDEPTGPGYVQVSPASSLVVGSASTLNVDRAGQTLSAATIVPVDAQGRIAIYTLASTELIVDVAGWFTDASAPVAGDGRFVPFSNVTRIVDTRSPAAKLAAGEQRALAIAAPSVIGNLAITETDSAGFVQLGPTNGFTPGSTANVNASGPAVTVSNAFVVPAGGGLRAYSYAGTHIIVDVSGVMT